MSDLNYGHTGYTGTSAFVDPTRELFVILLTNRVYPDDAASVGGTRQAVADAAVRVFDDLAGQPQISTILPDGNGGFDVNWAFNSSVDSIKVFLENGADLMYHTSYPADSLTFKLPSTLIPPNTPCAVKLESIYNNEPGMASDTYCFMKKDTMALIVDGYDRISSGAGWGEAQHAISGYYAHSLPSHWGYTSCDNQAVISGDINLSDFNCVLWFCGDESVSNETFDSDEQARVKAYLEAGGKLFVSGSEIGYDLSDKGSSADKSFYGNYLKASYAGDNSNDHTVYGRSNTRFEGLGITYGNSSALYEEDYPDMLSKSAGSSIILHYGKYVYAGIAYVGTFGTSADTGKVVTVGFPFETITEAGKRQDMMERIITFFEADFEVSVDDVFGSLPETFKLAPAFPNPFNPLTTLSFDLGSSADAVLSIYNTAGQHMETVLNDHLAAGHYALQWDGSAYPSGTYFCRLQIGQDIQCQKLVLLK